MCRSPTGRSTSRSVSAQRRTRHLGLWAGDGGEGAKFWFSVQTKIKNRGVDNVCITVCGGLKGLPEAFTTAWGGVWSRPASCTRSATPSVTLPGSSGTRCPAICAGSTQHPQRRQPRNASSSSRPNGAGAVPGEHPAVGARLERVRSVPGLRRRNPPGHLQHQRHRISQRPLPARSQGPGRFPTEQAALKCLYLATWALDPTGKCRARWPHDGSQP